MEPTNIDHLVGFGYIPEPFILLPVWKGLELSEKGVAV